MGQNLHVAKKYEVEYGKTTGFPNKAYTFYNLLDDLGAQPNATDSNGDMYSDYFECPVLDYDDAIKNLKMYIKDPNLLELRGTNRIKDDLEEAGMTAEEALDLMERYQSEADTSDGFLHFINF